MGAVSGNHGAVVKHDFDLGQRVAPKAECAGQETKAATCGRRTRGKVTSAEFMMPSEKWYSRFASFREVRGEMRAESVRRE